MSPEHETSDQAVVASLERAFSAQDAIALSEHFAEEARKSGAGVDGVKAIALYVVSAQDGGWRIITGQNSFLAGSDSAPLARRSGG